MKETLTDENILEMAVEEYEKIRYSGAFPLFYGEFDFHQGIFVCTAVIHAGKVSKVQVTGVRVRPKVSTIRCLTS